MVEITHPQLVTALSGLAMGIIAGLFAITRTEVNVRASREIQSTEIPIRETPLTEIPKHVYLGALAIGLVRALFMGALCGGVGLAILHLGGVGPLGKDLGLIFALTFVVGAFAGKYARYWYWKRCAK